MQGVSLVLAGAVVDISIGSVLALLGILALVGVATLVWAASTISIVWNAVRRQPQRPSALVGFSVGICLFAAWSVFLYLDSRPQEPALVAELDAVMVGSVVDESAFDPEWIVGRSVSAPSQCSRATLTLNGVDWATGLVPLRSGVDAAPINEVLSLEADRLERLGWSVHRFVDNDSYGWERSADGPLVIASNEAHVVSIESFLNRYEYRLVRRSCAGDRAGDVIAGDRWREVDALLALPYTVDDARVEADELAEYMWSTPSVVTADHALGYGTNQLCASARVESRELAVADRANVVLQIALRMETAGWDVRTLRNGERVRLVAQRDDRFAVAYYSTTISSEKTVLLRSYPEDCVDPSFVSSGFS